MLGESDIETCQRILHQGKHSQMTNFEVRMVAEVKLYWIIYKQCCNAQIDRLATQTALSAWKQESTALFGLSELPAHPAMLTFEQMSQDRTSSKWATISLNCFQPPTPSDQPTIEYGNHPSQS